MRRIALIVVALAGVAASLAAVAGADDTRQYEIEMYNAFGVVEGSDVRISGVNAGSVKSLDINEEKRAVVTVEISGPLARLGEDTTCSSEPQSLIAEYFVDCEPAGPELPDGGLVPAAQVSQTVQPDLVQSTLREPFRDRLRLLINDFGTALAGNPESLNEAIRLGAPALTQLREVTKTLGEQNAIIRDLNVNSDEIIGQLNERSDDVVRFVQEARDTAEISISRREDLSRNFEILDDFLAELEPTLGELERFARTWGPCRGVPRASDVSGDPVPDPPLEGPTVIDCGFLTDLRAAAPELDRLATDLPPFNRATTRALKTLGPAARVGRRALRRGKDELETLARAGRNAPASAEMLADFLNDLDDPRRAVGIDDRAEADTGRANPDAGQPDTRGYTGLEGLLNYAYYFALGTNQFDQVGHKLAITLYEVFSGPCGFFSTGRDPESGDPGIPAQGGGKTTDIREAARCLGWLGPNQPGLNDLVDADLPKYDPSVCAQGTFPERARQEVCDPNPAATQARERRESNDDDGERRPAADAERAQGGGDRTPTLPDVDGAVPGNAIDDLLDIPRRLDDVGKRLRNDKGGKSPRGKNGKRKGGGGGGGSGGGGLLGGAGKAAQDLLDFLFGK